MDDSLDISVSMGTSDFRLMESIINQGIDSRLEGFTKSTFERVEKFSVRWNLTIHPEEVQIFMRRLWELAESGNENAYDWEDDILKYYFGVELLWD
jgi:hypothetical protein